MAVFLITWIIALAIWKFDRIEEKWTAGLHPLTGVPTERRSQASPVAMGRTPHKWAFAGDDADDRDIIV